MIFAKKKITMDDLKELKPTSKLSLKMSCMALADGDVDQAKKIYNFFADDMNLPDMDPAVPSTFSQVTDTIGTAFGWFKENQGEIMNVISIVQALRGKATVATTTAEAASAAATIPPLPTE